jgi:hypothetical protein
MTPQQIFDYKREWMPGHVVTLHSDLTSAGKDWCKRQCEKQEWHFKSYTDIYQHTFMFENIKAAQNFEMEFAPYTNQDTS